MLTPSKNPLNSLDISEIIAEFSSSGQPTLKAKADTTSNQSAPNHIPAGVLTLLPKPKPNKPKNLTTQVGNTLITTRAITKAVSPVKPPAKQTKNTIVVPPTQKAPSPVPSQPSPSPTGPLQEVHLIYCDISGNNNKRWYGALLPNQDVYTEWGRVGKAVQKKTYPRAGQRKLNEKEREKLAKGYTRARVMAATNSGQSPKTIANGNLQDLAIRQIAKGEPVLTRLVTLLVQANIHQITSQSQITYNDSTGLFQTPLGIVTADAIQEAYQELGKIETAFQSGALNTNRTLEGISRYLRLIPQDFGMKLNVNTMFPNQAAIQKQVSLLDSLEASYNTMMTAKPKPAATKTDSPEPTLFEITVKICDPNETKRIRTLYHKTKQDIHRYVKGMDVKAAYEIEIPTQRAKFETFGAKMDNIWELWHGTKLANVLNILRVGLSIKPPRGAKASGSNYGPGLYFSDQSSKSLNYATDYWGGGGRGSDPTFFMFLAEVAMGKYMVPDRTRNSRPPKGFDSYFAKAGKSGVINNEMIIPDERQFNIVRLVEFS